MLDKLGEPYRYLKSFKNKKYASQAREFMKRLVPKAPKHKGFVRLGRDYDGGYVMLDEFSKNDVAYSIGICDDTSWDEDISKRDIDVFMYDHTIAPLKVGGRLHFFKTGVCGTNTKQKDLLTLEEMLIKDNNISKDIILKIDVEGAEWDVFSTISEDVLKKFSQIAIELHWICNRIKNKEQYNQMIIALDNLNKTHQVIHVHGNNYSRCELIGGVPVCQALEVTYIRKGKYEFLNQKSEEAHRLDLPCYPKLPDYTLCVEAFRTY